MPQSPRSPDPTPAPAAPAQSQPGLGRPPERIGPYRLLRRLGEGGMGAAFAAEHTELLGRRTVNGRDHRAWRQRSAEALADSLDPERFGVSRVEDQDRCST